MQALAKIGLVVVSTLLITLPAQSAYMLGNPSWEPLTLDYLKAHDIDPSFMDEVLDGGGEFTCLRIKPNGNSIGMTTLSAWFVDGDRIHVITSAHTIYSSVDGKPKGNYEACYVITNRDALESDQPKRIQVDPDTSKIMIGGEDPLGDSYNRDRSLVPLHVGKQNTVRPIELQSNTIEHLIVDGKIQSSLEVFMVSAGRNGVNDPRVLHVSPKIQTGTVWGTDTLSDPDQPGKVILDLDWHKGDSASMLFIRDALHPTQLLPLAILRGGVHRVLDSNGEPVDGLPFDPETNNAQAILLDGKFMNFPLSVEQVPKSALPSKIDQNPK